MERLTKKGSNWFDDTGCVDHKIYARLAELEDKLENGILLDFSDGGFVGSSTYIAKDADCGYPVLVLPISETEVEKLLENGVIDYREVILTE